MLKRVIGRRAVPWILASLLLTLLVAAPAGAGQAWLATVDISADGRDPQDPQVAVDAQGNAVAVWTAINATDQVVRSAARPAGRRWQASVRLSHSGQVARAAEIAVGPLGTAVAVWERGDDADDSGGLVQSAARSPGAAWQMPAQLSAFGRDRMVAQVAVDAQGNAIAVWAIDATVQAAVRPAGGGWQAPVDLSAAGKTAGAPQISIDGLGNAVAVWEQEDGDRHSVQSATRPAGGAWQAPIALSTALRDAGSPGIVLNARGDAVAVWERFDGADSIVQAAVRPAGAVWQAPTDLSSVGRDSRGPSVAVDGQGNAIVVWRREDARQAIVQSAERRAGGAWRAPVNLTASGQDAANPQVAVNARGDAIAVWQRLNSGAYVVRGAVRPAGRAWQATVSLSTTAAEAFAPQVAIDPHGAAVAIWEVFDGKRSTVQSVDYDAGPELTRLRVSRDGRRVRYALSVAGSVRFTVERIKRGRRVEGGCVRATRSNRESIGCTRYVRLPGSFVRSAPAGLDRFTFSGRLERRALKPGRYSLVGRPTADGHVGRSVRASLRVVR